MLLRDGVVVLHRRGTIYVGLCDAMFHKIRQAGSGQAAVLIRLIEVIDEALEVDADPGRRGHLLHHVRLTLGAGQAGISDAAGRADLEARATQSLGRAAPDEARLCSDVTPP